MRIVDSHLHFWQLARGDYLWLTPELSALYRDFTPSDIDATLRACGVGSVVAVQAAATEAETRYLLELAHQHAWIAGVVGWTDFEAEDAAQKIVALRLAALAPVQLTVPRVVIGKAPAKVLDAVVRPDSVSVEPHYWTGWSLWAVACQD
jgi:predicted TIM-barrel fold metal-dependent hydrolase